MMVWVAVICAVATAFSWLMALVCNKQYRKFGDTDSRWLEFWLAARIFFTAIGVGFLAATFYTVALSL